MYSSIVFVTQSLIETPAPGVIVPSPQIRGITEPDGQKNPSVQAEETPTPELPTKVPAGVMSQMT